MNRRGLITLGCSYPIPPLPCNAVEPLARFGDISRVAARRQRVKPAPSRVKIAEEILSLGEHAPRLLFDRSARLGTRQSLLQIGPGLAPLGFAPEAPADQVSRQRIMRILLVPAHRKIQRNRRRVLPEEELKSVRP